MVEILDNTLSAGDILQLDAELKHLRFIGIITRVELDTWCVAREGKPLAPPIIIGCEHGLNGLREPIMLSVNMSKQASDRIDAIANLRHACQYRLPVPIQAELRIFDDPTADIKLSSMPIGWQATLALRSDP
jgi:hypothetical protein